MTPQGSATSGRGDPGTSWRGRRSAAWTGFAVFATGSLVLMLGVVAGTPDPSGQVALVFSPRLSASSAVTAAAASGARIVRLGRFAWIVVVAPAPDDSDFAARAHRGGALAILNPRVAGGCPDPTPFRSSNPGRLQ